MKKRKPPILLMSLLLVLIGGALVMGMSATNSQKPDADHPTTPDNLTDEQAPPTPLAVEEKVKAATPMQKAHDMVAQSDAAKGPSINVPRNEVTYTKPKPGTPG